MVRVALQVGPRIAPLEGCPNVETQVESLKVPKPIANLSATFGATIGQNGCAGIYPAMLATMIAPTMGVDPLSFSFITGLVAIVAVSSFGIAGVGGLDEIAAAAELEPVAGKLVVVADRRHIDPLAEIQPVLDREELVAGIENE